MKFSNLFFSFLCTLLSITSLASNGGGWISSGGESFYDAKNPWFLRGESISYCLEVDEKNITLSQTQIDSILERAISYWQSEFKGNQGPIFGHLRKSFKLGENKLIKTSESTCKGDEDLRVLIGSDTLNEEEKNYLFSKDQNYVGVAVRTSYDPKSLRAKGFIYMASDKDINGQNLSTDNITSPWQHEKLLLLGLIHELGHVFGIPHMGSSLMSEVFIDLLISKYYYADFIKAKVESFIGSPRKIQRCKYSTPDMVKFFDISSKVACLELEWKNEKTIDIRAIYPSGKTEDIGKVVSLEVDPFGIESRPIGFLRLTKAQQVFTPDQVNFRSLVPGPLLERYKMKGKVIVLKNFKSFPIYLSLSPEAMAINAAKDEKLITIFSYDSPYSSILGQTLDIQL